MQAMDLDLDEVVDVREEKGRIVIEPVRRKTYVFERSAERDHRKKFATKGLI